MIVAIRELYDTCKRLWNRDLGSRCAVSVLWQTATPIWRIHGSPNRSRWGRASLVAVRMKSWAHINRNCMNMFYTGFARYSLIRRGTHQPQQS